MSGPKPLPSSPLDLPLLPLRDVVVFPHMVIPLFVGRAKSIKALELAMEGDRRIMLVAQKTASKDEPAVSDMFEVGCICTILQMLKRPDGTVKVLVEGQQRARVDAIVDHETHFLSTVLPVEVDAEAHKPSEIEALRFFNTTSTAWSYIGSLSLPPASLKSPPRSPPSPSTVPPSSTPSM